MTGDGAVADGGEDAGTDVGVQDDTGVVIDGGADGGVADDTGAVDDTGSDAGVVADVGQDTGNPDAGQDGGTDVGSPDVGLDAGSDGGVDTGVCACDKTRKCDKNCSCDPDCADAGTPDSGVDGGSATDDAGEEMDDKDKTPIGCACTNLGVGF